ncbi:hypothetical protein CR513_00767, partial [Mucuna pruriens]
MFVTMDVIFFELISYFKPHFQEGNRNENSFLFDLSYSFGILQNENFNFSEFLQTEISNLNVLEAKESGVLDAKEVGPPTKSSHDLMTTNNGETIKETTTIMSFGKERVVQSFVRPKLHKSFSTDLLSHVQCAYLNSEFVYSYLKPGAKLDDSNIHIAIRKGVRSCTQHPLFKGVSYENLSPTFCAFTSQLSVLEIPNNV